jgi:hypothetical protein
MKYLYRFEECRVGLGDRHDAVSGVARGFVLFAAVLGFGLPGAGAQTTVSVLSLPDSPGSVAFRGEAQQQAAATAPQTGSASILGVVLDINEGIVPEAKVELFGVDNQIKQTATSDSGGLFNFNDLPAGKYTVAITAEGLQSFVSAEISLRDGQKHTLPKIALPIATANTDVQVRVTERELAEEQIHAEMKQRMLGGLLPNFYSSYIWNAAPLKPSQKFELALRSRTDPTAFVTAGLVAGIEQARDRYPGYGDGGIGYLKRYGASYATGAVSRFFGSAIYPSIFHQDPRYFYKGSGTVPQRAWYAMTRSFVAKGDNGKWQPNYSHILGSFTAGLISNTYHPSRDRGIGLTAQNTAIGLGSSAGANLVREFLFRKLTRNVPDFEQGQGEAKNSR